MPCKIALVVEAAKMSYFFNGFIRKAQKLLTVVDTCGYYMLEDSFSVDMLIFTGQIVFADIELRGKLFKGDILGKMVFYVAVYSGKLLF